MISFVGMFFMALVAMVKGPRRLAAENTALRHQISVLRRKHPGRVRLSRLDRIFLGWLAKICPSVLDAIVIVRPETVLRWHRYGFRTLWRCKSPNPGGRPAIDRDLKQLIKSMARDNPLWVRRVSTVNCSSWCLFRKPCPPIFVMQTGQVWMMFLKGTVANY